MLEWFITALILMLGCWVQTTLGFGMAVLAAPVVILVNPVWVPYVLTFTALVLSIGNTYHLRQHLQVANMMPAFVSRIPGTVVGAWVLVSISALWLHFFVAISVLIAVLVSYKAMYFRATPVRLSWAGFLSGLMGTTTSIGGPPMALVMQFGDPDKVRANLSAYFAYSCTLSLLSYTAFGLMTVSLLLVCFSFMPSVLIGFGLGVKSRSWIDQNRFRPTLLILCTVAGIFALTGAILKLLGPMA